MFYPELYQIFNNEENRGVSIELIDAIDNWFAFLPENSKDKITIGRFAKVFNIHYDIARGILEKLSNENFLKRLFAIRCSECNQILKITDEQTLYQEVIKLKSHITCYNCDCEIYDIDMDQIEVRYKLILKPTNEPTKIKNQVFNILNISDRNNDSIKDILEKANYDSNILFYDPTEEEFSELENLFCGFMSAKNTGEKGTSLEEFARYLIELIKPVRVTTKGKTFTNQIDGLAVNKLIGANAVLDKMGHIFMCECKNEQDTPKNEYYHKLANILNISTMKPNERKFGIIFSKEKPPSTYLDMAKKNYYTTYTTIITFYAEELKKIVYDRVNLLGYIDYKISLIEMDLRENVETKEIFI